MQQVESEVGNADVIEKLHAVNVTPKQFLMDSCVAIVKQLTNNAWVLQVYDDEMRKAADLCFHELVNAFGSTEEAVKQLAKQDIAAIVAQFKNA